jgi:hypothetical protein
MGLRTSHRRARPAPSGLAGAGCTVGGRSAVVVCKAVGGPFPDIADCADYIKDRLESEQGSLRGRLVATGKGSREMIVGTGRDDASDSLDRRVELKVMQCGGSST